VLAPGPMHESVHKYVHTQGASSNASATAAVAAAAAASLRPLHHHAVPFPSWSRGFSSSSSSSSSRHGRSGGGQQQQQEQQQEQEERDIKQPSMDVEKDVAVALRGVQELHRAGKYKEVGTVAVLMWWVLWGVLGRRGLMEVARHVSIDRSIDRSVDRLKATHDRSTYLNRRHHPTPHQQALDASLGMRGWLERELGEDHPVYASCLNNIALFYKLTNEFEEAVHWYSQALHKCVCFFNYRFLSFFF
jgi:hypothetical protein